MLEDFRFWVETGFKPLPPSIQTVKQEAGVRCALDILLMRMTMITVRMTMKVMFMKRRAKLKSKMSTWITNLVCLFARKMQFIEMENTEQHCTECKMQDIDMKCTIKCTLKVQLQPYFHLTVVMQFALVKVRKLRWTGSSVCCKDDTD